MANTGILETKDIERLKVITVLYVEKDIAIQNETVALLQPYVKEIVSAKDGEEGLQRFRERAPDIVITALKLPAMDGLTMTEAIRRLRADIPVIITTAFAESDLLQRSIDIGIDAFITKPIDFQKLLASLYKSSQIVFRKNELQERSEFIRVILDSSPTFMLTVKDNRIEYVNKTFLRFMGYDTLEKFLNSGGNIIDHIDKIEEDSDELFDTNMWLQYIITTPEKQHIAYLKGCDRKSAGKPYIIQYTKFPELERYMFTFSDISQVEERKEKFEQIALDAKKEIELKQKILEMQSRQAQMGEMIGAIAHQWKQPLNSLNIIIQDVEDAFEYGELDETYIKNMVKMGLSNIAYMSQTIDDFKNFFKPNKEKTLFDIETSIRQVLDILGKQYQNNNIAIEIDTRTKLQAYGFNNEFKQVIINLLNNARDAFNDNNISKRKVHIAVSRESDHLQVSIKDNAGGIPLAVMDRIFEPYVTTKSEDKGTGIGLYMSKIIIEESMKGSIKVRNHHDMGSEGAEFIISLPLA